MNHPPRYIVVRLDRVTRALDRLLKNPNLPTMDVDAILSGMVEAVERPNLTGRGLADAVMWLLQSHGLRDIHLEQWDCDEAEHCFMACLIHLRERLRDLNPYINGRLNYRYKERRGLQSAILEYSPTRG